MFSEIAGIALVAARLGQFLQFLKTQVILIINFTRPMRLPIQTRNVFGFYTIKTLFLQCKTPNRISKLGIQLSSSQVARARGRRLGLAKPSPPLPLVSFALLTLVCSAHSPDRFPNPRWPSRLHCNNLPLRPRVRCVTIIPHPFVNLRQ